MQLVLLSGGAGKRLWPLSNNARSKQFLHLLKSPSGGVESMIQRVVRQIKTTLPGVDITFATSSAQRDSITNQIGDNVRVVVEPERRDTFPAIALASSYLSMEKHCDDNEVVVVMPCDVYTEYGYFDTIAKMVKAVHEDEAELVLMGVKPTCPSEKYGYIVPSGDKTEHLSWKVSRFTEKPNFAQAEQLLMNGAFWNGGVFAFKLGYLMNIVRKYLECESFNDIIDKYVSLPKISFDYEVVERASSVAFVAYDGKWKDLGTWNILCEELTSDHIGNVYMGKNNINTHVVNELGLPVFCEGLQDVVVAASPDGIMVCSKKQSEGIKDYVDVLVNRPMFEERRWGTYRVLDTATYSDGAMSLTKSLVIKAGKNISYHLHHYRSEVWTIVDGIGEFVLNGVRKNVKRGDVLNIPIKHSHAIRAITDLTLIEVQAGNPLNEEDIERFDWEW